MSGFPLDTGLGIALSKFTPRPEFVLPGNPQVPLNEKFLFLSILPHFKIDNDCFFRGHLTRLVFRTESVKLLRRRQAKTLKV